MTKHKRTKRRSQKGGFWPFTSSDPNAPTQSWGDYFSGVGSKVKESGSGLMDSANSTIGNIATGVTEGAKNMYDSTGNLLSTDVNMTETSQSNPISPATNNISSEYPQQVPNSGNISGGRRRRSRSMKGGKGQLGLTYYASPVSGLKVASPTSWQFYANGTNQYSTKGGSRKRQHKKNKRKTLRHKKR